MFDLLAHIDRSTLLLVNQFAGRSAALDNLMSAFAGPHILTGIPLMAMVAYCWFRRLGPEYLKERQYLVQELVGTLLAGVISRGMQLAFAFHPRPLHDPSLPFHAPIGLDPNTLNHWSSFPSDHAAVFFCNGYDRDAAFPTPWRDCVAVGDAVAYSTDLFRFSLADRPCRRSAGRNPVCPHLPQGGAENARGVSYSIRAEMAGVVLLLRLRVLLPAWDAL
jgi:hypothetical protein